MAKALKPKKKAKLRQQRDKAQKELFKRSVKESQRRLDTIEDPTAFAKAVNSEGYSEVAMTTELARLYAERNELRKEQKIDKAARGK